MTLAKILNEPFNYVWNNRDVYDLVEFSGYEKYDSFREGEFQRRYGK